MKNINFTFFIPQLRALRLGVMKFTTFRLLSLQMQYTKSEDYIDTVVFEMKLLMNDNANDGLLTMAFADWW